MTTGKTIALTRQTFVGKVMSLLFNTLSRLVMASLIAQVVKNPPGMKEIPVHFLGQEDPLKKEMATHSSSCLENSIDGGAWWATVHRVAKSWTRLSDFT